jgi:hypothetical protein
MSPFDEDLRPYSKSSLTLNEWKLPLSVKNNWRVSSHIIRYDTNPPAIQKQQ